MGTTEENIEAVELQRLRTQLSQSERARNDNWVQIFNQFDKDGDGLVSYKELKHELKTNHRVPSDVSRKILKSGDLNKDGYLDLNEFLALLKENKDVRGLFSHFMDRWVNTVCYVPRSRVATLDTIDSRGRYEEEYSYWPPPLWMLAISLLEIIVYVYDAIVRKPNEPYIHTELASLFIYNPRRRAEAWRFLTYMFVHIGIFHLIVNLIVQILLGLPLEMVHKGWRVIVIYLSGVVAGSLGASISDPQVLLAGASGGVYALITAHLAVIIMNWKEMAIPQVNLAFFILLAATDSGVAIYNRYVLQVEDQISYVAHIAGAIAGLLIGINVLRNLEVRPWERRLWWISIVAYTALMLVAIVWHIAFPRYFPKQIV